MDSTLLRGEHEEFVKRMESENERQNQRLSALEDSVKGIANMITDIRRLADSMENMQREQEKQGKRLETLEARDGEMWRKVVGYVVTAVIGIVIGFIATQIGM